VLAVLVCPSDYLPVNPVDVGSGRFAAVTSYGGNGGTRTVPVGLATNDGVFSACGPYAQPTKNLRRCASWT